MTARVVIEADGGSRGNPGPAAYGAVLRNGETGELLAEHGEVIGIATNNVAEYRGLIAGLELARRYAPDAAVEVRMDSQLVVEQMTGRWKIKHPDMRALADEARRLCPPRVSFTWIPRAENAAADALVNRVLDGDAPVEPAPTMGWRGDLGAPSTTLILLRHGVTEATQRKLFSGSGGADPVLTPTGEEQARRAADWLARRGGVDAVVSSPLRRAQETAAIVATELGLDVELEPGVTEASFGDWDGHSFAQIQDLWPGQLRAWLDSTAVAPPGGETFDDVDRRVAAARDRLIASYPGGTVVVVSHVTPIKMSARQALGAPMSAIYRMELGPASVTTVSWWADGTASLRDFNVVPR